MALYPQKEKPALHAQLAEVERSIIEAIQDLKTKAEENQRIRKVMDEVRANLKQGIVRVLDEGPRDYRFLLRDIEKKPEEE